MPDPVEFTPNWVSAPGDTINDLLTERGIAVAEFANRMCEPLDRTTDLLQGRASVTIRVARQLEAVLGASVEFWMSRDFQYRQGVARLRATGQEWLKELPLGDLFKFGWIAPVKPADEVAACLDFFAVPSIHAWREKYALALAMAAYRTSAKFDSRPAAVAAWLRKGEIEAANIRCKPWDVEKFREALIEIRSLTREKDPARFLPKLTELCASCGVAVVVVRAPNGCRASGAARFLSEKKALIQLSFRHLSDDQFWFTFFHEAGHIVLHGHEKLFLEGFEGMSAQEESEANQFAEETLIPPQFREDVLKLRSRDTLDVIKLARKLGIGPGIVVGQLQHHRKIPPDHLNKLKRRFTWTD
jgi:HTH-type transcriptional regulator/antitoxin HigA